MRVARAISANQTRLKVSINSVMDVREFRCHHHKWCAESIHADVDRWMVCAACRIKIDPDHWLMAVVSNVCLRTRTLVSTVYLWNTIPQTDSIDRCLFLIESRSPQKWNMHINLSSMMIRWAALKFTDCHTIWLVGLARTLRDTERKREKKNPTEMRMRFVIRMVDSMRRWRQRQSFRQQNTYRCIKM